MKYYETFYVSNAYKSSYMTFYKFQNFNLACPTNCMSDLKKGPVKFFENYQLLLIFVSLEEPC